MNVSAATTNIGRGLLHSPRLRVCQPGCLRPSISRRLAIRIGPDLIDLLRERQIGRILNRVGASDRYTPYPEVPPAPLERDRCDTFESSDLASVRARLEQSMAQLERELNRVEARLNSARVELGGILGSIAKHRVDEPVAYAYRWNPDLIRAGSPPSVVYVPGIVRTYVSPLGRLVDVSM